MLENLALRHQLMVLRRTTPKAKLHAADRFLWVLLQGCWSKWQRALVFVQPRTVLGWHGKGFRLFWRWKSRPPGGRPCLDCQLATLIRQMWLANPTWGSKRIQAELRKLAINISDSTIRKYRPSGRRAHCTQTWTTFLRNHGLCFMPDIYTVCCPITSIIFTGIALIEDWSRIVRSHARSNLRTKAKSSPCRCWEDCTTATLAGLPKPTVFPARLCT